jgi:DNA-binding transcriptional ArsR family regulator
MTETHENPYSALERIFHEPSRMAILSSLLGAGGKMTFLELKDSCSLTDGNLSRHLKALEEEEVVRIDKRFVGSRPRTTIHLTRRGRGRFLEYLEALEAVLEEAASKAARFEAEKESRALPSESLRRRARLEGA